MQIFTNTWYVFRNSTNELTPYGTYTLSKAAIQQHLIWFDFTFKAQNIRHSRSSTPKYKTKNTQKHKYKKKEHTENYKYKTTRLGK